jgi:hypothetical protein
MHPYIATFLVCESDAQEPKSGIKNGLISPPKMQTNNLLFVLADTCVEVLENNNFLYN